jgi:hypothetical protein
MTTSATTTRANDPRAGEEEPLNFRSSVEGADVRLRLGAVGFVRGEKVDLRQSGAGLAIAGGEMTVERGGARTMVSVGALNVTQGGAAVILSGGETSIQQGGAGTLVSFGPTRIEQGGSVVLVTPRATVGARGFVGIALTPRLELAPGARVLAGPRELSAGVLGLAAVVALVALIRR